VRTMARAIPEAEGRTSLLQLDRDHARVEIDLRVIGRIRTPFVKATGTPIQPTYAQGAEGQVIVDGPVAAASDAIEGLSGR
jgi:tRNA (Thr-GGU) A37 N-methylase